MPKPGHFERADELCLVANALRGKRLIEVKVIEEAAE